MGQALSIRADLLPPAYIDALTGLQDRVPAFDSAEAKSIIALEWGLDDASKVDSLFQTISAEPVAAASLGQVYKGTLRKDASSAADDNGDAEPYEVAVKVQRPQMAERIAIDLVLLRQLAALARRLQKLNTDLVGVVDDWGLGFVDELDYVKEAENTKAFLASLQVDALSPLILPWHPSPPILPNLPRLPILHWPPSPAPQDTPLRDVVTAPGVVDELSTSRVLVTRWVDGERLEKSQADDVSKLCGVALNAYLTMLLGTGLLHCDPHPGNLLRTTDGRLCILDWGLVTQVSTEVTAAPNTTVRVFRRRTARARRMRSAPPRPFSLGPFSSRGSG